MQPNMCIYIYICIKNLKGWDGVEGGRERGSIQQGALRWGAYTQGQQEENMGTCIYIFISVL